MFKFLIIQTAFIGDVVLATALVEKLNSYFPEAEIDFLLRKGNEELLKNNTKINKVLIWDKKKNKNGNLLKIIRKVRKERYTHVINVHRFSSSGIITWLSGAKNKIGFDKNPFSFCYSRKVKHIISEPYEKDFVHETMRNQSLISYITDDKPAMPKFYFSESEENIARPLQLQPYICIAPSSVWFTKQFPVQKWIVLINSLPQEYTVYLLGAASDRAMAELIINDTKSRNVKNLYGELSFLQSAALMKNAAMNYVNDSAPLHFASATNAPVTAVFCSTVPAYGFGPLSDKSRTVEVPERLYCRPCGLHGYNACPQGHFRCAMEIENEDLLWWISKTI
jgi:heptosyltransferase-2